MHLIWTTIYRTVSSAFWCCFKWHTISFWWTPISAHVLTWHLISSAWRSWTFSRTFIGGSLGWHACVRHGAAFVILTSPAGHFIRSTFCWTRCFRGARWVRVHPHAGIRHRAAISINSTRALHFILIAIYRAEGRAISIFRWYARIWHFTAHVVFCAGTMHLIWTTIYRTVSSAFWCCFKWHTISFWWTPISAHVLTWHLISSAWRSWTFSRTFIGGSLGWHACVRHGAAFVILTSPAGHFIRSTFCWTRCFRGARWVRVHPHAGIRHRAAISINSTRAHHFIIIAMNRAEGRTISIFRWHAWIWHFAAHVVFCAGAMNLIGIAMYRTSFLAFWCWLERLAPSFWRASVLHSHVARHLVLSTIKWALRWTVIGCFWWNTWVWHRTIIMIHSTPTFHHVWSTFTFAECLGWASVIRINVFTPGWYGAPVWSNFTPTS